MFANQRLAGPNPVVVRFASGDGSFGGIAPDRMRHFLTASVTFFVAGRIKLAASALELLALFASIHFGNPLVEVTG